MVSENMSRRTILRLAAGGAVAMGAGGFLAACSSDGTGNTGSSATPVKGGNLRVGMTGGGAGETLDPFKFFLTPDILRVNLLYSTVGEINGDAKPQGLLAESVSRADDKGQIWDIRLRDGLEFHNGKTITAEDMIWSFQHMLDPKTLAVGATLTPWIDPAGIKKLDERTARFTLTRPVATFEQEVFNFATTIVPASYDPNKPAVGAGAFKYESFTPGDRSVFTRNENFFGQVPFVDQVEIISFKEPTALVNALLAGDIDIAQSIGAANAQVGQGGGAKLVNTPSMSFVALTMAVDAAPFDDERVREAFRLIANRPQALEQTAAGRGSLGNDLYSVNDSAFASEIPQREQNLDRARSLLEAAGHKNLSVELATTAGQSELCQVFAHQAKEAGVEVKVVNTDADTFYSQYYGQAPFSSDTFFNGPYMYNTRLCQLPDSVSNQTHWNDPEFNRLYEEALTTLDSEQRSKTLREMQKIQHEKGAMIITSMVDNIDATSSKVGGLVSDTKWQLPLNGGHLEKVYIN